MKKMLFLLLICISCTYNRSKNILGNWYTYSSKEFNIEKETLDIIGAYYEEVFLTRENIFGYSNIQGFMIPHSYNLKNDSLFTGIGKNSKDLEFRGKVHFLNKNTYVLVNEFQKKDTFYRIIENNNTLDKFLIKRDSFIDLKSDIKFMQSFHDRKEKILSLINK